MSKREVKDHVVATRQELSATLDELEHRVSPEHLMKTTVSWVSRSYDQFPARWLTGIGIALLSSVAAVLWAVFGDDD
jgi:hypothetical protein